MSQHVQIQHAGHAPVPYAGARDSQMNAGDILTAMQLSSMGSLSRFLFVSPLEKKLQANGNTEKTITSVYKHVVKETSGMNGALLLLYRCYNSPYVAEPPPVPVFFLQSST